MARRKAAPKETSVSPSRSPDRDRPAGPLSIVTKPEDREHIKVNNANLTDLKNACDDALKKVCFVFSIPQLAFELKPMRM